MSRSILVLFSCALMIGCSSAALSDDEGCNAISQLPCYCTKAKLGEESIAGEGNLIAPCYASATQRASFSLFGLYSANSWAAINWPLDVRRDAPDYRERLQDVNGDTTVVWDGWKSAVDVFLTDGRKPKPWRNKSHDLPASCRTIDVKAAKARYAQVLDLIPDDLPPKLLTDYVNAEGDVAVDRNGALVWYETIMNKTAFDYIVDNELYNRDGQDAFFANGGTVSYPSGETGVDKRGTYFLKAAWKVLAENDRFNDMHKAWAYLYPVFRNGTLVSECELRPVGLLGLHVTYKLGTAPQFAWATFEHVRVAPDWDHVRNPDQESKRGDYLLFDRDCDKSTECAFLNTAPDLFPGNDKPPQRSQLVRQQRYGYGYVCDTSFCNAGIDYVNDTLESDLASSVWHHYLLKGTQWMDRSDGDRIKPVVLANTAIEPYIQPTSSCLSCHMPATVKFESATGQPIPDAHRANNIFVLQRAKPQMTAK